MISPDAFTRTHKRHVTDMIRVSLERKGIIGFIEIHENMTLLEARALVWENVENAPTDFQFVLDDGAPVSARQENTQKILHFYPCVKIRECKKPPPHPAVEPTFSPGQSSYGNSSSLLDSSIYGGDGSSAMMPSSPRSHNYGGTTEKISVWTASGDEFSVWISEEYTFQQLRRDAARYWTLPATQVALVDSDGCLWPEQARILSVMSVDEIRERKIILESNAGSMVTKTKANSGPQPQQLDGGGFQSKTTTMMALSRRRSSTDSSATLTTATSRGSRTYSNWKDALAAPSSLSSTIATNDSPVEELWRVFTFYCASGDSLELECIKAHQFNRLLRDARVLGPSVTPAMADIIYASETKGKPHSSGKMNFDEFLNALVKIAVAKQQKKSSSRHFPRAGDTQREDDLFQRLVVDSILPLASRWPTHLWERHTQLLRTPDIVGFVSKFLESLLDIYMFYAKSHLLTAANAVKEFYLSYADYQRFVNDFAFANLQISSVEAAQVFLAACSSPPVHEAFCSDDQSDAAEPLLSPRSHHRELDTSSSLDMTSDTISCSSSSTGASTVACAFQRLARSSQGVVLFSFPQAQVGRICMSFSAFLDALGRLGLTSFSKTRTIKPLQSVKAVFHHLSRGLIRSRVLGIVKNHGSASIHSSRFYSGSVAFNNKFLDMWRYEGSPDYLTGGGEMALEAVKAEALSMETGISGLTSPGRSVLLGGPKAMVSPLSPSKRLTSSAALFDERVVSNGAGRGREALDRLVRNAFIRNAVSACTSTPVSHKNDDAIELGTPTRRCDNPTSSTATTMHETVSSRPPGAPVDLSLGHSRAAELSRHLVVDTRRDMASLPPDNLSERPTEPMVTASPMMAQSPHTGLALHPDNEKVLYESILMKGGVFKKYGQWGNPHRRFVWCLKEFDGVYWRPINKKQSLSKDGIPVSSFIAVLPGNSARTRYAFMKHLSDEKSLSRCFSLVADDRRLDLEADSAATRDLWMQALLFLMKQRQQRQPS